MIYVYTLFEAWIIVIQLKMREVSQTLLVSACLIGLYIIGALLFSQTPPPIEEEEFHLGCFPSENNMSHSWEIENHINNLKLKMDPPNSYYVSRVTVQELSDRGYEAALVFQEFLMDLNQFKEGMDRSIEIKDAINVVAEEYEICESNALQNKFPQLYCEQIWNSYQNCSAKLNSYKEEISKLLSKKQRIEQKIKQAIPQHNSKNQDQQSISKEQQKEFKVKDQKIQAGIKKAEANIRILNERIEVAQFNYRASQNQLQNSRQLFLECMEGRKEFRLCQELSEEVKNLGYGNIQDLQRKLDNKKSSIMKIKVLLSDAENGQRDSIIQQQYIGLRQFKRLHKIFTQLKLKSMKSCGCTEEKQKNLMRLVEDHVHQKKQMKNALLDLKENRIVQEYLLNQLKQQRINLLTVFQSISTQLSIEKVQKINIEELLEGLKVQQSQVNSNLLFYEQKLQELSVECQNNQQQLSSLLNSISQVSTCRNKKEYLTNLQQNYEKNREQVKFKSFSKQRLVKVLKQFVI